MRILWEDSYCLVVLKPSGILTQGPPSVPTLESELREFLRVRDHHPGSPYLALPHRLDRPVSGAVLGAKNVRATKRFGIQFATRKIEKEYLAVLQGELSVPRGRWEDFMRKIPDQPLAEIVSEDHPDAQAASLEFEVVSCGGGLSLVRFQLETGRMHQIRLQASSRGFPILGDWQYGEQSTFGQVSDDPRERAIALHGRRIAFRHPQSAIKVSVIAPLPDIWFDLPVVKAAPETVIKG